MRGIVMMQITGQKILVNHEFERLREREIVTVDNVSQRDNSVTHSDQTLSKTVEDEAYRITLSPEQEVQKKTIESISGRTIDFYSDQQHLANLSFSEVKATTSLLQISGQGTLLQGQLVTDNSVLSVSERLYEYERLDYNSSFLLDDTNGVTTSHNFSLSYSRELDIKRQLTMTAAEFTDPLVLNIGQKAELFTRDKQAFDLDSDGQKELIPELASGIWYLAYDRNQNGIIDNGLELFGAQTGQGFTELAELDEDDNGLIEANDERFKQLSLWDGQRSLMSLADGGIRAISLNAVDTPFTFTDNMGDPIAQIRQTSIFLTNSNNLGAIHQVDVAV